MLHSNRTDWIVSACMAYRHTRLEELRLTEGGGESEKVRSRPSGLLQSRCEMPLSILETLIVGSGINNPLTLCG